MLDAPLVSLFSAQPRKRGTRTRICRECGKGETVRSDNTSTRCRSCAGRENAERFLIPKTQPASLITCKRCGIRVKRVPSKVKGQAFCSVACRSEHHSVERECKQCGMSFVVQKGRLSGKTNSSGNFCSRPCYETWLCRTGRITGRGSQWKRARGEAIRRFPFCAACGTRRSLQVHHIIPFRLTRDNDQTNLIPLCTKHHRSIETAFVEFEAVAGDITPEVMLIWRSMIAELQARTAIYLKELINDRPVQMACVQC